LFVCFVYFVVRILFVGQSVSRANAIKITTKHTKHTNKTRNKKALKNTENTESILSLTR